MSDDNNPVDIKVNNMVDLKEVDSLHVDNINLFEYWYTFKSPYSVFI